MRLKASLGSDLKFNKTLSLLVVIFISFIQYQCMNTLPTSQKSSYFDSSDANRKLEQSNITRQNRDQLIINSTVVKIEDNNKSSNCSNVTCSIDQFSDILQKISNHEQKTLERFKEINGFGFEPSKLSKNDTEGICIYELLELIKELASNELEMKEIISIANDDDENRKQISTTNNRSSRGDTNEQTAKPSSLTKVSRRTCIDGNGIREDSNAETSVQQHQILNPGQLIHAKLITPTLEVDPFQRDQSTDKSRAATKAIANIDHWIQSLERFVATSEWTSAKKVLVGVEAILETFVSNTDIVNGNLKSNTAKNSSNTKNSTQTDQTVERLTISLPEQFQALTTSLSSLFPWHVWPWNNVDLYSTIDTFLNHGLFAFSKTTSKPERRIDYLGDMLEILFKSLKLETFPRRCQDWSRSICERQAYTEWLAPIIEEESSQENKQHTNKTNRSQLMQELTCIMFSSLSMQSFGASSNGDVDMGSRFHNGQSATGSYPTTNAFVPSTESASNSIGSQSSHSRLPWDEQVHKALRLYSSARAALSDQQWRALYKLIQDLWAQQKISDRLIMSSRVIQLLTNCHMPREMLESALWKDIYKYKNVLKQLIDIVIEELTKSSETGQFRVDQLALGSKHLNEILTKFIKLLPKLIESLTQTFVDELPDLVSRFFHERQIFFRVPCKNYSFSDILPSLGKHRNDIIELEALVCQQLDIKPNITMMKINNFTNEFLAMAFNFTSFSNALGLPNLVSNMDNLPDGPRISGNEGFIQPETQTSLINRTNVTSILDELATNERLAPIVAILQSSALDPPEVHAELPELDWVEAGTSIALLYESIQKLLSFEAPFMIFPEVDKFQREMKVGTDKSRAIFKGFTKRDPIRLIAYGLDTVMPVVLRTYKAMESLNAECSAAFRDLVGDDNEGKAPRQYQCAISSLNYASWAAGRLMKTFNDVFTNILAHPPTDTTLGSNTNNNNSRMNRISVQITANNENGSIPKCAILDGSVDFLLMNLGQLTDLALDTSLTVAMSSSEQQPSYKELLCKHDYQLDPFVDQSQVELRHKTREKLCTILDGHTLTNCGSLLKFDDWKLLMSELNRTWFESSATSIEPSFRVMTIEAHRFLQLFGQFKPQTLSDGVLAQVFSGKSNWSEYYNKITFLAQKILKRRFELSIQILTPIIYENLPTSSNVTSDLSKSSQQTDRSQLKQTLIATILNTQSIIDFLTKRVNSSSIDTSTQLNANKNPSTNLEAHLSNLFNWAEDNSLVTAEVVLGTISKNISKLERLFEESSGEQNFQGAWVRFCLSPIDKYLYLNATSADKEQNSTLAISKGKDILCSFEWASFKNDLNNNGHILERYDERRLVRTSLAKFGQLLDLLMSETKTSKNVPKFARMSYWQALQEKIATLSPNKDDEPSNLMWIWVGFERIVRAYDKKSGDISNGMTRIFDQLNCGLEAIRGGISWENLANIYQDKHDVLAAHSTINNIFELVTIGYDTLADNNKFHLILEKFVKPKTGFKAFCEMRDKSQLSLVFAVKNGEESEEALESFQDLVCDTNLENIIQNMNPISVCYQQASSISQNSSNYPLANSLDRLSKLTSLAIIDAKLISTTATKPLIFDKSHWNEIWKLQKEKSSDGIDISRSIIRVFQTIDSINSNQFLWRVLFKSVHEMSEALAYSLRAMDSQFDDLIGLKSRFSSMKKAVKRFDTAIRSNESLLKPRNLITSLTANTTFPESKNYISYKTFKQIRYIKSLSEYYTNTRGAQESICSNMTVSSMTEKLRKQSRIELIGYKLDSTDKLVALLCHYHPSQWLTVLNVVISKETSSISKKINIMTKQLSVFTRKHINNGEMKSFIHFKQLKSIESSANATISYFMSTTDHPKLFTVNKISNFSWHALPDTLDEASRYICYPGQEQNRHSNSSSIQDARIELGVIVCKSSQWNFTQVYSYLSEKFDLQNLISSITPETEAQNGTALSISKANSCSTFFRFSARWLRIIQNLSSELSSKTAREKIRKCLKSQRKSQNFQTLSLRYVKMLNTVLASINDMVGSDSWHSVKKMWNNLTRAILDEGSSYLPNQW